MLLYEHYVKNVCRSSKQDPLSLLYIHIGFEELRCVVRFLSIQEDEECEISKKCNEKVLNTEIRNDNMKAQSDVTMEIPEVHPSSSLMKFDNSCKEKSSSDNVKSTMEIKIDADSGN